MFLFLLDGQVSVSAAGLEIYGKTEQFSWSEYNAGGKLLQESGPIFTLGLMQRTPHPDRSFGQTRFEYVGGSVDYDGATWNGDPVASKTDYSGLKAEYVFYNPILEIDGGYAFLGFGYSQWNRDLISTPESQGYLEKWKSLYAKLGYRQERNSLRFEAGLKYPLRNENGVEQFGSTTRPGRQASVFGEVNWAAAKNWDVSLTYDSMQFTGSEPVYASRLGVHVYQPESKSSSIGLSVKTKF